MPVGLFLPDFAIWRAGRTSDGKGGWTTAFALSSTVVGRLSPLSAAEVPRGFQERGVIALRFSTPSSTDIEAGDEVRKGDRTVVVEVVKITSTGNRKECVCEEVNVNA